MTMGAYNGKPTRGKLLFIFAAGIVVSSTLFFMKPMTSYANEKLFNVQGKMTDGQSNAIQGTKCVTFRLYDSVGSSIWGPSGVGETNCIDFNSGLFNVTLGSNTSLDNLSFTQPYYMGMQVAGDDNELTPTQLLGASAYAMGSLGGFNVNGNLGVGAATTYGKLHVSHYNDQMIIEDTDSNLDEKKWVVKADQGKFSILTSNDNFTSWADVMRVTRLGVPVKDVMFPNGNVGIGTTNPTSRLHVEGTAFFNSTSGTWPFMVQSNVQNGIAIQNFYNGLGRAIQIQGGDNMITFNGNGNMGFGTIAPGARYHFKLDSGTWPFFIDSNIPNAVWIKSSYTGAQRVVQFSSDAGAVVILGNGTVGVGTSSPDPAFRMDVAGRIRAAFYETSDMRLKRNVQDLPGVLDKAMKLRGVTYAWDEDELQKLYRPNKGNGDKTEIKAGYVPPAGQQIGVVAQELEEQFPGLVVTDEKGYKAVSYSQLNVVLLEVIKEHQKQIEELKVAIKKLK